MISDYLALFIISMAASFHCVGMCGGIAGIHSESIASSGRRAWHLFLYHFGRIWSYLFIGILFGAAGSLLLRAERALALLTGGSMVGIALAELGRRRNRGPSFLQPFFAALFRWARGGRSPLLSLYVGLFNGLLPCSLVYAFAAEAASSGSVIGGVLTMVTFGLGTVPAMLFSAQIARRVSPSLRARFVSAGALFILVMGVMTMLRGLFGGPEHPAHIESMRGPSPGGRTLARSE